MIIHPVKLPLFVYGTLRSDRKYSGDAQQYNPKICRAHSYGKLHYVDYTDYKGKLDVTVAFDPEGAQKVLGQLFSFKDSEVNQVLALFDEKEFNFHNLSDNNNEKRKRVYIRTVISCTTEHGESVLAWAYIYVSTDHKPSILVNPDCSFGADTEFIPISHDEYINRILS